MSRVIQRISAPPPLNSGQDLVDLLVPFASILLQGCREHLAYLNKIACTQRAYTCTQRIQACEHAHLSTHVCMHTQTRMNPSPDKHGLSSFVYAPLQPLRSPSLPPTRLPHRHPPRPPAHMVLDHLYRNCTDMRHIRTKPNTRTHKHTNTQTHTCIRTYIHTYMHTYIRTYIHTYIHTYITYIHT